jgi:hypothetical protein
MRPVCENHGSDSRKHLLSDISHWTAWIFLPWVITAISTINTHFLPIVIRSGRTQSYSELLKNRELLLYDALYALVLICLS